MSDLVQEFYVSVFRGKPEDVPIADGVDMDAIRQADANPMFVTLPIAEIGAVSNNGLLYDEQLVDSIAEQINANRPGGILGHLKEEERSTAFPLPAGFWVGARRVANTLWAKSYIPSSAAKDYMGNLKRVGGEIATSIYGKGKYIPVREGVRRLTNFKLESLDFAPPSRAALGLGAVPHLTAEMNTEQEAEMPVDKAQVIAELTVAEIPASLREAIVAEASKASEEKAIIAELTNTVKAKEDLIAELNSQVETFRRERVEAAVDSRVAELTDWEVKSDEGKAKLKKLRELLRGQILTRMGGDLKAERVAEMSEAAWTDLQPLAEMIRDALAGPPAAVSGRVREMSAIKAIDDTPANREAAMSDMGIVV